MPQSREVNLLFCSGRNCSTAVYVVGNTSEQVFCNECAQNAIGRCADCNERFVFAEETNSFYVNDYGVVCGECAGDYSRCEGDCDEVHNNDDLANGYCNDCYHEDDNDNDLLCHGYDRRYVKIGLAPFYGIELELESRGDRREALVTTLPLLNSHMHKAHTSGQDVWIAKSDGSLNDNKGAEFESLPLGRAALQPSFSNWQTLNDEWRGYHGYNCGMHVNLDNPGAVTCLKLLRLTNEKSLLPLMEVVAQRDSNQYWKQNTINMDSWKHHLSETGITQKYAPMKVDGKRIEFRMFKSNLKIWAFNKALDFCQSLVDYCSQTPLSVFTDVEENNGHILTLGYLEYLNNNRHLYKDLTEFLIVKNVMFADKRNSFDLLALGLIKPYSKTLLAKQARSKTELAVSTQIWKEQNAECNRQEQEEKQEQTAQNQSVLTSFSLF